MASQQETQAPCFKIVKERLTLLAQCSDAAWHRWAATSQFELNPMFGSLSAVGPNQLMH